MQTCVLTSSSTLSYEGGGLEGTAVKPSAPSCMAGTPFWGLFRLLSLSPCVSVELLLVEEFDFDILLNFSLNGATLPEILFHPPRKNNKRIAFVPFHRNGEIVVELAVDRS